MTDSRKPSDTTCSSHPPPPCDPFTRFSQPWPRSDKDEDNPFIQFRRFADESLNSLFSGFPKFFGQFQQQQKSWHDDFERQMQDHIKRSTEMEEGIRKQIEQNFEEMRQAFHKQEEEMKKGAESVQAPTQRQPWWQAGDGARCPALKGEISENSRKCPALYDKEGNAKTELDTPPSSRGPWWTRGSASRCPALNEERSTRAQKCPAIFDKAGSPKTELDAYKQLDATSKPTKVDTSPYEWSSGLGWDGKVKKSLEQAHHHNRRSWAMPRSMLTEEERSSSEFRNPETLLRHRRAAFWMNPFNQPHSTIPWLVLSPYSPVYLCNPELPSALLARFTYSLDEPFSMRVVRSRDRSILTKDLDHKMARALPWADAFEDLISLEQTGTMVERNASTFKTPKTWIHDMAQRGSLGPFWGFNDLGQLAQRQDDRELKNKPAEKWQSQYKREKVEAEEVVDAVVEAQAQGTKNIQDELRRQTTVKELREPPTEAQPEEKIVAAKDDGFLTGAIVQKTAAPDTSTGESWSSSSTTWSSHDIEKKDPQLLLLAVTRSETKTLPDGSVQTTTVSSKTFADGREEKVESVNITPSTSRFDDRMTLELDNNARRDPQGDSRAQQDYSTYPKLLEVNEEGQGIQTQEKGTASTANRDGAPMPADATPTPNVAEKQTQTSTPVQDAIQEQKRKGGWFWN